MSKRQIVLTFYLEHEVFSSTVSGTLQGLIDEWLGWPVTHICKGDPRKNATSRAENESLESALQRCTPTRLGRGNATLFGPDDAVVFYLESARSTLPAESNAISIELYGLRELAGKSIDEWAYGFFSTLVGRLSVRYGSGYEDEEFEAKNFLTEGGTTKAIGVQLLEAIPGIYWLNYFGAPFVRMIGEERLLSVPSSDVRQVGKGILLRIAEKASVWRTEPYREREAIVRDRLSEFVFDRNEANTKRTGIRGW